MDNSEKEFRYDHQALVFFALRSSVVIATVLAIPDAVALIPGATTITAWVLRIVSCWIAALVLWFVFFSLFLHVVRFLAGGVRVSDRGVRLWRLGRLIPFDSIVALSVEPELAFTRIFSYNKTVRRFTIFTAVKHGPRAFRSILWPHYVPSFLFSLEDFDALTDLVGRSCGLAELRDPRSLEVTLKTIYWQRLLVSVLIGLGVTSFLVRKTVVLYSYNQGLRQFKSHDFVGAGASFLHALAVDPNFAPAWHGLAGAEFSVGDFAQAREHWETALRWKPDYVEAKVSLAYLCVQQRQFDRARELLDKALHLDPFNNAALLNQADLDLRTGHIRQAVRDARLVLSRSPGPKSRDGYMASCLLADARLLQDRPQEAARLLAPLTLSRDRLTEGENLTYRLIVGARTCLALGQLSKADMLSRMAFRRSQNVDTLLLMARVRTALGEYDVARRLIQRVSRVMPWNPWVYIEAARVNLASGDRKTALSNLESATQCRPDDSLSLWETGRLYLELDDKANGLAALRASLALEPENKAVSELVAKHRD
ncbi:MAG: tetratricopeptide repeat protein [Candidatus Melainabacteria bacterium]|nr:tetratricopeptide repeat protein [Candidatus Melainabacteria bacterium]